MNKIAEQTYTTIPLTKEMVENGELKVDDYVMPQYSVRDHGERYTLEANKMYKVVRILTPRELQFPGGFYIKTEQVPEWGFHFGKNGLGDNFSKVEIKPGYEIFHEYEDLPYQFMKYLRDHPNLSIEDAIKGTVTEELKVPPRQRKQVVNQLADIVDNLIFIGFIEEASSIIKLTEKGIEFLNAE